MKQIAIVLAMMIASTYAFGQLPKSITIREDLNGTWHVAKEYDVKGQDSPTITYDPPFDQAGITREEALQAVQEQLNELYNLVTEQELSAGMALQTEFKSEAMTNDILLIDRILKRSGVKAGYIGTMWRSTYASLLGLWMLPGDPPRFFRAEADGKFVELDLCVEDIAQALADIDHYPVLEGGKSGLIISTAPGIFFIQNIEERFTGKRFVRNPIFDFDVTYWVCEESAVGTSYTNRNRANFVKLETPK